MNIFFNPQPQQPSKLSDDAGFRIPAPSADLQPPRKATTGQLELWKKNNKDYLEGHYTKYGVKDPQTKEFVAQLLYINSPAVFDFLSQFQTFQTNRNRETSELLDKARSKAEETLQGRFIPSIAADEFSKWKKDASVKNYLEWVYNNNGITNEREKELIARLEYMKEMQLGENPGVAFNPGAALEDFLDLARRVKENQSPANLKSHLDAARYRMFKAQEGVFVPDR